jgi:hypothetical protein
MRLASLALIVTSLSAQTTVHVRASGPAAVGVIGTGNTTPETVQTGGPHGLVAGDEVGIWGVCTGTTASPVNGIRKVKAVVNSTHYTITDLNGVDIATNGPFQPPSVCAPNNAQHWIWMGKLTPFLLGAQPNVWFDSAGKLMRKFSLGTANGLTTISRAGCPSACVLTVTTSFNPLTEQIPIAAGQKFSVWGTASTELNTHGGAGAGTPYTVASVSSSGWVSTPESISGATDGATTTNAACGPASPPNGTIGGTQDCVRLSFLAFAGNPIWEDLIGRSSSWWSGNGYKLPWDGGVLFPDNQGLTWNHWATGAIQFLVDVSNTALMTAGNYIMQHLPGAVGVNYYSNELVGYGGSPDYANAADYDHEAFPFLYQAWGAYVTPAVQQQARDAVLNDLDDPSGTPCSKAHADASTGHNEILATGSAQAGSSVSITLASGDSASNGFYVNNIIRAVVSGNDSYGLVTVYNSTTKVATVSSWSSGSPTTGTAYTIYATITSTGNLGGGTVTGYNTHFSSRTSVGDALLGSNGWDYHAHNNQIVVTAMGSDTSLTSYAGHATITTPAIVWYMPKWQAGDCGYNWMQKHAPGYSGSIANLYPPQGGTATTDNGYPNIGSNTQQTQMTGHMASDLAMAADDPRAIRDLAMNQGYGFDYLLAWTMHYWTGFGDHGSFYSMPRTGTDLRNAANIVENSIPSYPSQDLTGPWAMSTWRYKIFNGLPDFKLLDSQDGRHAVWLNTWGSENYKPLNQLADRGPGTTSYTLDQQFIKDPLGTPAKMLRYWLEDSGGPGGTNLWGPAGLSSGAETLHVLQNDPRIGTTTYTGLPHQYLFNLSSASTCAALTGWSCPSTQNGAAVISRTGLASKTDSLLYFGARTYFVLDHDIPEQGTVRLYKVGELLNTDFNPPGAANTPQDETEIGDAIQFGGSSASLFGKGNQYGLNAVGSAPIIRWASANHGANDPEYGDQDSKYAYACSDLSGAYTNTFNHAQRCVVHLKDRAINGGTGEEIIVQWDSVSLPSPTQIVAHVHYPQNGETGISAYPEGNTTCPGAGGCGALNTNRAIQSLEDGGTSTGDPTRSFGVLTKFLSPGAITVRWDCPGGIECNSGSTYAGGNGHTDRVSVCAGNSCGSSAGSFESLIVHKIAQNLTDTTLTTTALNPDASWTGVQTADRVVVLARGGTTHSAMSGFTTTHSGTAQYLFGGLTPGTYTVKIDNIAVPGSPFTVSANDNSIEFANTAGTVSINGSVASTTTTISGTTTASGNVTVR